jgi:hypothetical protein
VTAEAEQGEGDEGLGGLEFVRHLGHLSAYYLTYADTKQRTREPATSGTKKPGISDTPPQPPPDRSPRPNRPSAVSRATYTSAQRGKGRPPVAAQPSTPKIGTSPVANLAPGGRADGFPHASPHVPLPVRLC